MILICQGEKNLWLLSPRGGRSWDRDPGDNWLWGWKIAWSTVPVWESSVSWKSLVLGNPDSWPAWRAASARASQTSLCIWITWESSLNTGSVPEGLGVGFCISKLLWCLWCPINHCPWPAWVCCVNLTKSGGEWEIRHTQTYRHKTEKLGTGGLHVPDGKTWAPTWARVFI
jgi:hypothetical protein